MVSHNKFNSHEYESSEMINVFVYSEKKKKDLRPNDILNTMKNRSFLGLLAYREKYKIK